MAQQRAAAQLRWQRNWEFELHCFTVGRDPSASLTSPKPSSAVGAVLKNGQSGLRIGLRAPVSVERLREDS
jgi:hypothetical protein